MCGWVVLVRGIHEEALEDDLYDLLNDFGKVTNLHLNLCRCTGFVKGYALAEFETMEAAQNAIKASLRGISLLGKEVNVEWAFVMGKNKK